MTAARLDHDIEPATPTDLSPQPPDELAAMFAAYRSGASVTSIAAAFDMSFDAVATSIVAHHITRADPVRGACAAGPSASEEVGAAPQAPSGPPETSSVDVMADQETERAELVEQFRIGAEQAHAAQASLGRAVEMQATAVARLASSGLTIAAIADRLDLDDGAVEALLDERPGSSPDDR